MMNARALGVVLMVAVGPEAMAMAESSGAA
jgi:hypothetical protein